MGFDIETPHPLYDEYRDSWKLMRDAADGEDTVKAEGQTYLPLTTSMTALKEDSAALEAAYSAYKARAEFPEIVSPTIRAGIGVIHETSAAIELPAALEGLRETATTDGLPLDAFHRRITTELLTVGRYGILPAVAADGIRLAGYAAESIVSWNVTDGVLDFAALDEGAVRRDPDTNTWAEVKAFRELLLLDGVFRWREWGEVGGQLAPLTDPIPARAGGRAQGPLDFVPFVIVNAMEAKPDPDDIPLYGLAKIAKRLYQIDADYRQSLHMTAQPTPWVNGFDNPTQAVEDGYAPTTIGSAVLWLLGQGAQAGYLEFTGAGIGALLNAKTEAREEAVMFGAQMFADTAKTAESGEARRLRISGQTATFKQIAIQSAGALQRALRNAAILVGADPAAVTVEPSFDFMDVALAPADISALVAGWNAGAYSYATLFQNLKDGKIIPADRTPQEELALIDEEAPGEPDGFTPAAPQQPGQDKQQQTPDAGSVGEDAPPGA